MTTVCDTPQTMLKLSDCSLPYWRIGSGPDLVFVHGWPVDARTWRRCVASLSSQYTCHLFDLPRTGRSEWSTHTRVGVFGLADVVYDAIQVMNIEGRTIGFVGHDSGASYLRIAISRMDDRVAGLAMGNTETPHNFSSRFRFLMSLGQKKIVKSLLRFSFGTRLGRGALSVTAGRNKDLLHGEMNELFFRPLLEQDRRMDAALETLGAADLEGFASVGDVHRKITAPVRLIWGRRDPYFLLKDAQVMKGSFAGPCDLVVLDEAGLMAHEERPEEFSVALDEHFDRCFHGAPRP